MRCVHFVMAASAICIGDRQDRQERGGAGGVGGSGPLLLVSYVGERPWWHIQNLNNGSIILKPVLGVSETYWGPVL